MKKASLTILGLALVISLCGVLSFASMVATGGSASGDSGSHGSGSRTPDLETRVWDMGTYIKIQNRGAVTWTNVKLELNSGLIADGYTVRVGDIGPGRSVEVGMARFAKSNGERFNPRALIPINFGIWCDQGYHYGEW